MTTVSYIGVQNHTQKLIQKFLAGEEFTLELSEQVFQTFSKVDQTSYLTMLEHVKNLLNNLKKDRIYDFIILNSAYELLDKEKAVLVRYINISYKGNKNIIILNNNVLHIGSYYEKYGELEVKKYIDKVINELRIKNSFKQFKQKAQNWKRKIFFPFNFLSFKASH